MGITAEMTKAYFDSKDFHYNELRDGVLRCGIGDLDNMGDIDILINFDDNDRTVGIRSWNLCKFPAAKKPAMYEVCSKLNDNFRWIKFYVDERDNTITAADDAVVQPDSAGEELFELVLRMMAIVDEAYPELMRAIYT